MSLDSTDELTHSGTHPGIEINYTEKDSASEKTNPEKIERKFWLLVYADLVSITKAIKKYKIAGSTE